MGSRRSALGLLVLALPTIVACSDDDGGGSADGVCGVLYASPELAQIAEGFDPTDVPRALSQLEAMEVQLELIKDEFPDNVGDSLDEELDYVRKLVAALGAIDPNDAAAAADAVNGLADEAAEAGLAAGELQRYVDETCGTTTVPTTPGG